MKISKKCQYALRAVLELASRNQKMPVKTHDIARSQNISLRFTEVILNELKHGGFVESRRGNEGGYVLARSPDDLKIQEIIEYVEGSISISREDIETERKTKYFGKNAFDDLWKQANDALTDVFRSKTFTDIVEYERRHRNERTPNYSI
jgi:Rrf2 family cysteine metabolism transcriptional repressor